MSENAANNKMTDLFENQANKDKICKLVIKILSGLDNEMFNNGFIKTNKIDPDFFSKLFYNDYFLKEIKLSKEENDLVKVLTNMFDTDAQNIRNLLAVLLRIDEFKLFLNERKRARQEDQKLIKELVTKIAEEVSLREATHDFVYMDLDKDLNHVVHKLTKDKNIHPNIINEASKIFKKEYGEKIEKRNEENEKQLIEENEKIDKVNDALEANSKKSKPVGFLGFIKNAKNKWKELKKSGLFHEELGVGENPKFYYVWWVIPEKDYERVLNKPHIYARQSGEASSDYKDLSENSIIDYIENGFQQMNVEGHYAGALGLTDMNVDFVNTVTSEQIKTEYFMHNPIMRDGKAVDRWILVLGCAKAKADVEQMLWKWYKYDGKPTFPKRKIKGKVVDITKEEENNGLISQVTLFHVLYDIKTRNITQSEPVYQRATDNNGNFEFEVPQEFPAGTLFVISAQSNKYEPIQEPESRIIQGMNVSKDTGLNYDKNGSYHGRPQNVIQIEFEDYPTEVIVPLKPKESEENKDGTKKDDEEDKKKQEKLNEDEKDKTDEEKEKIAKEKKKKKEETEEKTKILIESTENKIEQILKDLEKINLDGSAFWNNKDLLKALERILGYIKAIDSQARGLNMEQIMLIAETRRRINNIIVWINSNNSAELKRLRISDLYQLIARLVASLRGDEARIAQAISESTTPPGTTGQLTSTNTGNLTGQNGDGTPNQTSNEQRLINVLDAIVTTQHPIDAINGLKRGIQEFRKKISSMIKQFPRIGKILNELEAILDQGSRLRTPQQLGQWRVNNRDRWMKLVTEVMPIILRANNELINQTIEIPFMPGTSITPKPGNTQQEQLEANRQAQEAAIAQAGKVQKERARNIPNPPQRTNRNRTR